MTQSEAREITETVELPTAATVYRIERNDGDGWRDADFLRAQLSKSEASKLRADVRKMQDPSIKWRVTARTVYSDQPE